MATTADNYILKLEVEGQKAFEKLASATKSWSDAIAKKNELEAQGFSKKSKEVKAVQSEIKMYNQLIQVIKNVHKEAMEMRESLSLGIQGRTEKAQELLNDLTSGKKLSQRERERKAALAEELLKRNQEDLSKRNKIDEQFKKEATSIAGLTEKVKSLREQYNLLSKEQREGSEGKKITNEIKDINRQIETANRVFAGATEVSKADSLRQKLVLAKLEVRKLEQEYQKLTEAQKKSGKGQFLAKKIQLAKNEVVKANNELNKTNDKISKVNKSLNKTVDQSKLFANVFKKVGLQMVAGYLGFAQATVAVGNAIKSSIQTTIQFNRTQSKVAAILGTTTDKITDLTYQARILGDTTRYTATQVGELQVNLARLGYAKGAIVSMTKSALLLAQATGGDLAESAKLLGAVLKTYDLTAVHAEEIADIMAKATSKSALSFEYLRTALPIVGGTAEAYGFDLKDTIALVGALADTGMQASMAATATRNIILKLADPESKLNKLIGGKQIKDVREFADALQVLRDKGVDLATTLEVSSLRSATAMSSFIRSFQRIGLLKEELDNANGAAKAMADEMENNLGGSLTRLTSAWTEFEIAMQGTQGTLKKIIDNTVEFVNFMNNQVRSQSENTGMATVQEGEKFSKADNPQMQAWRKKDIEEADKLYEDFIKQGKSQSQAIIETLDIMVHRIDNDANEYGKEEEKYLSIIKSIEENNWGRKLIKFEPTGFSPLGFVVDKYKTHYTDEAINAKADASYWGGLRLAQDPRKEFLKDYLKKYEPKKQPQGSLEDPNKRAFTEMYTDYLKAKKVDRETYHKALKDSALARKDIMEDSFTDFLEQEMTYITRLSLKLAKARKMKDNQTLEIDGKIMTKEQSIKYGEAAIATHKDIIEMYKNAIIPNERNKYLKQEEIIALQESQKILKARMDGVRKGSKEEFALRKLTLENETALAVRQAEMEALKKENLTKEEQDKLNKIREDAMKNGLSGLTLSKEEQALIDEIREDSLKKGASEKEIIKEQLEGVISMRQQYQEMEFIAKRVSNQTEQIFKNRDKTLKSILYDENVTSFNERNYTRQSKRKIGLSPKEQAYQDAMIRASEAQDRVTGYESGKLIDPNKSLEQTLAEYNKAKEEFTKAQQDARQARMEAASEDMTISANTTMNELERLKLVMAAKQEELRVYELCNQAKGESDEAYAYRHMELVNEVKEAEKALADYRFNLAVSTASSISGTFDTISKAISESSEENERNVKRSKILGLAAVYIQQAVAIAQAIRAASESSITVWDLMANIATAVTTVIASTSKAISSIKQAKFAKGVIDLQGPGTGTSDSIPARLSAGESVMTAKATKLFKPLLLAMNEIATQPNVTLPTSYVGYNPVQTHATNEQLADSFKESVKEIHPVVSVVDYNAASNKHNQVLVLDNI